MQTLASIQPSWRTFNSDHVGGMMTFESKPEFIDSRFDIFEHRGVLAAYLQAMYLVRPLELFDQYKIDHVLVTDKMPVGYLLKHTPGWTLIEQETTGKDNSRHVCPDTGNPGRRDCSERCCTRQPIAPHLRSVDESTSAAKNFDRTVNLNGA